LKTLVIIFFGMMVHVNQPWSLDNTVVIPRATNHHPELRIPKDAVPSPAGWMAGFLVDNKVYVISLDGAKVRVRNTRGMFSNKRPNFVQHVPPLRTLAPKCKLSDDVRSRTITADLRAYIDYRGGRVEPDSWFMDTLKFAGTPWKDGRCVTCSTRYEADLDGNFAELELELPQFPGKVLKAQVTGNSELLVSNLPNPSVPFGHFNHHYFIYKDGCTGVMPTKGPRCTNTPGCPPLPTPFPDADCTNSHDP
jgi:hypothetical protein